MPAKIKSIEELRRELQAKESELATLQSRRQRLAQELANVEAKISALTGQATTREPGKTEKAQAPKRVKKAAQRRTGKPLAEYVAKILSKAKGGMPTGEITKAVQNAGYHTTSKNFYYNVAHILRADKRFQRVTPGIYKLA
jgi:septal ring factor EnvC (AmiA/AmiB activator)